MTKEIQEILDFPNNYYVIHTIYQKGKTRRLEEPVAILKQAQKDILPFLQTFQLTKYCSAKKHSNIYENASPHFGRSLLLKIDINKFFINTTIDKILLAIDTYYSNNSEWQDQKSYITLLGTFYKGAIRILPTGAPTSPILANIVGTLIDYEIEKILVQYEEFDIRYTRYVDDLTFSFNQILSFPQRKSIYNAINNILHKFQYKIAVNKTQWIKPHSNKSFIITGVQAIKDQSKVPRKLRRTCRAYLNNLIKDHQDLDQKANGYLAHIKSLDQNTYEYMLNYWNKKRDKYLI